MMANGWGSRDKAKLTVKRVHHVPRQEESSAAARIAVQSDEEMVDIKDLSISGDALHIDGPKRSIVRSALLNDKAYHVICGPSVFFTPLC